MNMSHVYESGTVVDDRGCLEKRVFAVFKGNVCLLIAFVFLPGFSLNIHYLYHGTSAPFVLICDEGLDERLSRSGRFGRGIYFRLCYSVVSFDFFELVIKYLSNHLFLYFYSFCFVEIKGTGT